MGITRYISLKCGCEKQSFGEINSMKVVGYTSDNKRLCECQDCGKVVETAPPQKIMHVIQYPHYNDSMGCVVQDKHHEKSIAKENGFVETKKYG